MRLLKGSIAIMAASLVLIGAPAYAYVDPTTSGTLVQYATAGAAGIAILVRLCWLQLRDTVDRRLTDRPAGLEPSTSVSSAHAKTSETRM